VVLLGASPAHAENDTTSEHARVEEVTVTAQKRVESLQQVPISAQVIGGQTRAQQNLNSLHDIAQVVPSVHIGASARSNELYIRGIGSGQTYSFDQSAGMFIDDIYHGRSRTSSGTFLDLERVEILKGPQSTFFGNNAIAGAFNIVTRKPDASFDGWARALYGEFGQYALEGAAGGPISESFAIRAAATLNGTDGWIDNVSTGDHQPRERNAAGRLSLRFTPGENLDVMFKVEGGRNRNETGLAFQLINCPPPAPFPISSSCKTAIDRGLPRGIDSDQNSMIPGTLDLDTFESLLTVDYEAGGHTFTSVTGSYSYDYLMDLVPDAVKVDFPVYVHLPERYHQLSQELRVASATGGAFEYLGGLYFQTDQLTFAQNFNFTVLNPVIPAVPALSSLVPYLPIGQSVDYRQREDAYAIFGSLTWNINDRWKLSGGLRGSWVEKDFDWALAYGTNTSNYGGLELLPAPLQSVAAALGQGTPGAAAGERSDHAWMPSARLQYQLLPEAMVYASYSRGFKAGGFNGAVTTAVTSDFPYGPEHVNAYEVGLKSRAFDDRVLLNLAVFRSEYSDLQVSQTFFIPVPGTTTTRAVNLVKNAATSLSQGVEIETQWAINQRLQLAASVTYLDAHYVDYPNVTPTTLQAFQGIRVQDLSGQPTPYAPKWSGSLTATFTAPLWGQYQLITELTPHFSSRYFVSGLGTNDELTRQDAYTRLDARVSVATPDARWFVDLIGKNLTDRDITVFNSPAGSGYSTALKETPRNVAIQVRYHF
jgi:outer membrane receptor protein involved in Fe transport